MESSGRLYYYIYLLPFREKYIVVLHNPNLFLFPRILVHGGGHVSTHSVCMRVLEIASLIPGVWRER